jgi:hypothetical protein
LNFGASDWLLQLGVAKGNGVTSVPYSRLPVPACRNNSEPLTSKRGDEIRGRAWAAMASA